MLRVGRREYPCDKHSPAPQDKETAVREETDTAGEVWGDQKGDLVSEDNA